MNPHQIVALGVRLVSIFVAISSLRYLVEMPSSMASTNLENQIYVSYVIGLAFLVVAAILWFAPLFLARRILPGKPTDEVLPMQAFDAARVGCSLIGLWLTVNVLPTFVWLFFSSVVNSSDQSIFSSLSPENRHKFLFYLAELVFALLLIFKSNHFAQFVIGRKSNDKGSS
jgi:hypothetical protein